MKKIILWTLAIAVLVGLVIGGRYAISYVNIATSYAAKITCSCYFISNRSVESVKEEDLYAVPFVDVSVDPSSRIVTASVYGIIKSKAYYRPKLGCTLLNGVTPKELDAQPVPSATFSDSIGIKLQLAPRLPDHIDSNALKSAIAWPYDEDKNKAQNTRAILVVYDGQIVAERYGENINANMPLLGWSMTKSVTHALISMHAKDRGLSPSSVLSLAEWQGDSRKDISLANMLHMSSGLQFEERYDKPSDATKMLFTSPSTAKVAINKPQIHKPETSFNYSSGTTNILQEFIKRNLGQAAYTDFPHSRLFAKLGMKSAVIEPDASGTYVGSSFMYATARDWAKFGTLYLNNGVVNGETLIDSTWINLALTPAPRGDNIYGAHFWMDKNSKSLPHDLYEANGFEGQRVTIIPSQKLIVVRLGCSKNDNFDNERLVAGVIKAVNHGAKPAQ